MLNVLKDIDLRAFYAIGVAFLGEGIGSMCSSDDFLGMLLSCAKFVTSQMHPWSLDWWRLRELTSQYQHFFWSLANYKVITCAPRWRHFSSIRASWFPLLIYLPWHWWIGVKAKEVPMKSPRWNTSSTFWRPFGSSISLAPGMTLGSSHWDGCTGCMPFSSLRGHFVLWWQVWGVLFRSQAIAHCGPWEPYSCC